MKFSSTQLANIGMFAGLIVAVSSHFGFVLEQEETMFIIGAVFATVSGVYNWYQRWNKGDLTLGGFRK